jgi:flavorubredoxin
MWGSTEKMAYMLREGLSEVGVPVTMKNLKTTDISDVMTDLLTSKLIIIGSPTINNGMLPTLGAFLTYIKGLKPKNRMGFAFGSYGWSGQAAGQIEDVMKELKWELPKEIVKINYIPEPEDLENMKNLGKELGDLLKGK